MADFIPYIRQRLEASDYTFDYSTVNDAVARNSEGKPCWIFYVDKAITPEQIRRCFDFPGYMLFVVDEKLMPAEIADRDSTPMWLRVLHGLYMGRVYTWNGRHLYGLHFDYDTGDVSESGVIQPDELLLVETGTWLRGWTGTYRLARFYDKQWWNETPFDYRQQRANQTQEEYDQRQSNARQSYEQARDEYQRQQQQREQKWAPPYEKWNPPASQQRDFMHEFMACGNLSAAKNLYRALAKTYHPDLNPDKDTTEEMQAINLAYEKAERLFT